MMEEGVMMILDYLEMIQQAKQLGCSKHSHAKIPEQDTEELKTTQPI